MDPFGENYSLLLIAVLSFFVIFAAQLLCCKARNLLVRHLPWLWVVGMLVLAVATLFGDTGGFIDLRSFFCAVLCGYAALCAAGIGLAHLVNRINQMHTKRYE